MACRANVLFGGLIGWAVDLLHQSAVPQYRDENVRFEPPMRALDSQTGWDEQRVGPVRAESLSLGLHQMQKASYEK